MDGLITDLQKIVDFVNGVDEGSTAFGLLLALFCFVVMVVIILFAIFIIKQNPDIFNNRSTVVTNNQKPIGDTPCE